MECNRTVFFSENDPDTLNTEHSEALPTEVLDEHMDMFRSSDAYLDELEHYITVRAEGKELISEIPDFLPTPSQPLLVGTYSVDDKYPPLRLDNQRSPVFDASEITDHRQLRVTPEKYENILQNDRKRWCLYVKYN